LEIKRHIPNFITLSNLLLGVMALIFASKGELLWSGAFIFLATIPDFLDGMMARILGVTSDVGKDLDSLADMVSFGVAPAILFYQLQMYFEFQWIAYLVLLVPLFAALRLAKFNNDDRQSEEFFGLPTPSVALFIASWPFMIEYDPYNLEPLLTSKVTFVLVPLVLSFLMVSELRLFSLKFKSFRLADNPYRYLLLLCAVVMLVFIRFPAIPLIIILYIILSIIRNFAR
jgi:CDP-diacylglycerol---serine O-phosphatidyltransferase